MAQMFRYDLYGLTLESNIAIPILATANNALSVDVLVHVETAIAPQGEQPIEGELPCYQWLPDIRPIFGAWRSEGQYRLSWDQIADYYISENGRSVRVIRSPTTDLDAAFALLAGPVSRFLLRLRGITCLHASAVLLGCKAVVLAGNFGAGKSTTAAALGKRHFKILAEDIVAISESHEPPYVQPGYPRVNLRSQSATALFSSPLSEFAPILEKYSLDLRKGTDLFHSDPAELAVVYILGDRVDDSHAPFVQEIPPQQALWQLTANSLGTYLLNETMLAREFEAFAQLVRRVPVRRLVPHADIAQIDDLCSVVIDDAESVLRAAPLQSY